MRTKVFAIKSCSNAPIEKEWREQLVAMLGAKPRRLSHWCELGLFGALSCIRKSGKTNLSDDVAIRVYSESGTISATRMALEQTSEHLPMPFTFMQTQPCQIFNALGAALGWHGDGYTTSCNNRQQSESALLQGIKRSALLAWVDDEPELINCWIWLEKTKIISEPSWQIVDSIFHTSDDARWIKIDSDNVIFQGS